MDFSRYVLKNVWSFLWGFLILVVFCCFVVVVVWFFGGFMLCVFLLLLFLVCFVLFRFFTIITIKIRYLINEIIFN